MRALSCGLRRATLALLLLAAVDAIPAALAADARPELSIARTETCYPGPGRAEGIIRIEGSAALQDGVLRGKGAADATILTGRSEMKARHEFAIDGTYRTAREDPSRTAVKFRVPGKFRFTVTKAPPLPPGGSCVHHVCVGQTMEIDYSNLDDLVGFDATLTDGRFEERKTVSPGGHPCEIVTKLAIVGGEPEGEILVTAEHGWIPSGPVTDSAGRERYIANKLTFTLPAHDALTQAQALGKDVRVLVMAKSYGGRLFEMAPTGTGAGSRFLEFSGLEAGDSKTLFYAWPAQASALERETVEVAVLAPEGAGLSGKVSFDVGLLVEVWNVKFVNETGKRRILVDEPLRIEVIDALGGKNPASALQTFDLSPVLRLEQTDFQPPPFFGFVVDWFGFDVLNWGEYLQSAVTPAAVGDPQKGPARITGAGRPWQVDADGSLIGSALTGRPSVYFRKVGTHSFSASIAGLVQHAGPAAADVSAPATGPGAAHSFEVEVKELPQVGGMLGVLFSCIGLAGDALDIYGVDPAKIEPLKRLKFVWAVAACLKSAGVYAMGQLPLKRGVEMQVAASVARQITAAPIEQLSTEPQPVLSRAKDEERRVQAAHTVAKGLDDLRLVLIRQSGLEDVSFESAQDGALQQAPQRLDFAALAAAAGDDPARAAAAFASGRRVQGNDRFLIVPVRRDEALRVHARGSATDGAIWVLTRDGITRTDIPRDKWAAGIEIGADGAVRQRRAALRRARIAPLDLGPAPQVRVPLEP